MDNEEFKKIRRKTRPLKIGSVPVGGGSPVTVQSMTNTDTRNIKATTEQINRLAEAGCEIIRCAVPDPESAACLSEIKEQISIPLVADIHFDYRLALKAAEQGVDGLRINPGNIGGENRIKKVVSAARAANLPIRIGVNSGSLSRDILQEHGGPTPEAMVESAVQNIKILENEGFYDIILSLKSTSIWTTLLSYRLAAHQIDYPFHIGITEAGSGPEGIVKSASGLGALLSQGYGDTLRVSLTGDPLQEVITGWQVLQSMGLRQRGPQVISCPTCGRTGVDLPVLTEKVKELLSDVKPPLTVAVMGCEVNGPGEARSADIGIAAGKKEGIIFKKGQKIKKVPEEELISALKEEIEKMIKNR